MVLDYSIWNKKKNLRIMKTYHNGEGDDATKIKYFIIIVLLACLLASIVVSCPSALAEIRYAREGNDEMDYIYEVARQEREQYDKLISYCKEHEDMYMEISEQVFGYMDEGLSVEEACAAMENNATSDQKEILEQTILRYSGYSNGDMQDSVFEELAGNGLYYIVKDGYATVKAIYIHECSAETEDWGYTIEEKINDHLYVCYTIIPYT